MTYVIAEPCVDVMDRSCVAVCPVDCIYTGARKLYIHPDECIDCNACETACPVDAIFFEEDLPEQWAPYSRANVDFFEHIGAPGGASSIGACDTDAACVAALPPRTSGTHQREIPPPVWVTLGRMVRRLAR